MIKFLLILKLLFLASISFAQSNTLNKQLIAVLDTIYYNDQEPYKIAREIYKKYGTQSKEALAQNKINRRIRAENLTKVEEIIADYGWLGPEVIGEKGCTTLWLVIQHSEYKTQKKYYPIIKEASDKGIVSPGELAYLEDRIATYEGKKQIYGSQIKFDPKTQSTFVWPIEDPEHVDERRKSVGLGPLAPHIKRKFGLTWNLESHKKRERPVEEKKVINE